MVAAALPAGRAPRAPLRVPVDILSSHGIRLTGKTRNVSEGGMFVETALLLPVGSPVRCGVSLADSPVEVLGRVAWSRPRRVGTAAPMTAGMGIQFVGFDPQARWLLRQVIATAPEPIAGAADETARIRRAGMGPLVRAMVFAAVTAASAGAVMAVLESRTPAPTTSATATGTGTETGTVTETGTDTVTEPAADTSAAATTTDTITIRTAPHSPGAERTVVRIPLRGEPAGLRHYPLASPAGVAILLDGGGAAAPASLPLDTGPVRLVRVGGDGREIRVFTRGGIPRYEVIETGEALRVIIEPPSVTDQP